MLRRLKDPRWIALVLIGAVAAGSYAIGPAIGGSLLTKKKAKGLFFTKDQAEERFLDQAEGDGRYLDPAEGDGRYLDPAEGDGRYLSSSGDIRLNVHANEWLDHTHTTDPIYNSHSATFSGAAPNLFAGLPFAIPVRQFGRTVRVVGVEYCYDTVASSTLDEIRLLRTTPTEATPAPGVPVEIISDTTNHTDADCQMIAPASPVALDANDMILLEAQVDYSAAGSVKFTRTTLILRP
jgi:hypothetical protein